MSRDDNDTSLRLTKIEALMIQVLDELRRRRGGRVRRTRSVAERAASTVNYKPTELQMAAARRALLRNR
ncbi:MAG: hypothetical protein RL701_5816 [Pseudomonadota bacterium]|jgi:hypothetical protein